MRTDEDRMKFTRGLLRSSSVVVLLALLPMLAAMAGARAAGVELEGSRVELPLPPSQCALDAADKRDAAVIDFVKGTQTGRNAVLLVFAPCDQLQAYRAGRLAADDLSRAFWAALADDPARPGRPRQFRGLARVDFVKGWAAALADPKRVRQGANTAMEEMEQRLKQLGTEMRVTAPEMAVLAADEEAIYVAMIFTETHGGKTTAYSLVSATTLIAGYGVSLYLTEDPPRAGVYHRLQATAQSLIRAAIAATF
jgi:hypothetical protein